jgi:hypothetical protein
MGVPAKDKDGVRCLNSASMKLLLLAKRALPGFNTAFEPG